MNFLCSYAGIGSREISLEEHLIIAKTAEALSNMNMLLYSGNASGSDQSFQKNSKGKCVVFLPWEGFEQSSFDYTREAYKWFIKGKAPEGLAAIDKYHPNPKMLSSGGKALMSRNYYQIHGVPPGFPRVRFVVCCATPKGNKDVEGGTGFAVRMAHDLKIPVVNIRIEGWRRYLKDICANILKEHR